MKDGRNSGSHPKKKLIRRYYLDFLTFYKYPNFFQQITIVGLNAHPHGSHKDNQLERSLGREENNQMGRRFLGVRR